MVSEKGSVTLSGVLPRFVRTKDCAVGRAQVPKADEKVSVLVAAVSSARFLCS